MVLCGSSRVGSCSFSMVLVGSQWFLVVVVASQFFSVVLTGSRRFSVVLVVFQCSFNGSQWFS